MKLTITALTITTMIAAAGASAFEIEGTLVGVKRADRFVVKTETGDRAEIQLYGCKAHDDTPRSPSGQWSSAEVRDVLMGEKLRVIVHTECNAVYTADVYWDRKKKHLNRWVLREGLCWYNPDEPDADLKKAADRATRYSKGYHRLPPDKPKSTFRGIILDGR